MMGDMAEDPSSSPFVRAQRQAPSRAASPPAASPPAASPPAASPSGVSPFARRPTPNAFTTPVTSGATSALRPVAVAENLPMGFMAGLVAALAGAALWALITLATNHQITWMAVGVGFLVGWAIRVAGKGRHTVFGIVGATLAVGGCAVGNLLVVIVIAARQFGVPLQDLFMRLTPDVVYNLMQTSFRPMHLFYYAIAIYEGYRFSIIGRTP
jgi:hypothetical protein